MTGSEETQNYESLSELEQIEGNYWKMDFFVGGSLILFTIWVFMAEKNFGWTVFLGLLAVFFTIRGLKNFGRRTSARAARRRREAEENAER